MNGKPILERSVSNMSEEEIIRALKEMLKCNGIEEGGFNEVESSILQEALNLIEKQNNRLEQLEKENKELKDWKSEQGCSIQEVYELFIPKSIIREKIEKLESKRKKYFKKDLSKAQYVKSMKMWGAICYLKELLGDEQ